MNSENKIFSVTEINSLVKDLFDNFPFFNSLQIKGELSNYKGPNINGHLYFSLKDKTSVIKCVMFKYDVLHLKSNFKNGDNVIINASLSSYIPSGTYQLIVKNISYESEGNILLEKKLLIEKLDKEGLFNKEHKKILPLYPYKIGVIVGKGSAASKDIEYNLIRRWPLIKIKFYYSLVQGDNASVDLIKNLKIADLDKNDVLILARGGGSEEDLNAFDDETLARTIYSLNTPLISAVGHEINKSIADLVADKYASTPTGACEIALPNKEEVITDLLEMKSYFNSLFNQYLYKINISFLELKNNKMFLSIESLYNEKLIYINDLKKDIYNSFFAYINENELKINHLSLMLDAINPNNILKKGYTLIKDSNNNFIKTSKELNKDNKVTIIFADDEIKANIIKE